MVNKDRIVPIEKIDFLSMIGTVLAIANVSTAVVEAENVQGDFVITGSGAVGNKLANQPVRTLDFATGVTGGTVYFVAAYDFEGFKIAGAAAEVEAEVKKDGITLYKAVLSSGSITVTAVTP